MRLTAAVAAALVLAVATPPPTATRTAPSVPAALAAAAPVPTPSPDGTAPVAPRGPGAVTVGVVPSTAKGPDGRSAFTYKLNPGVTVTDHVGIVNHSARPVTVAVYASDAFTTAQGGYDLLPADSAPVDVGAWVRLPRRTVTIPSTSRLDIPFTLTVPRNATPGDHAGGIVASLAGTSTDALGNQVRVDHRVGSRIYLRVAGQLAPGLRIEDLRVRHTGSPNPLAGGTVTATFTVRNTGNVRLAGVPSLRVAGPFDLPSRTTDAAALPEILPGGALRATVRMTGVPPLAWMSALAAVRPRPIADQVLDPPPATATAEARFWAPPWPQTLLALGLGLAGWAATAVRRRRRRHLALAIEQARAEGRADAAGGPAPAGPAAAGASTTSTATTSTHHTGKDDS